MSPFYYEAVTLHAAPASPAGKGMGQISNSDTILTQLLRKLFGRVIDERQRVWASDIDTALCSCGAIQMTGSIMRGGCGRARLLGTYSVC